MFHFSYLFSVLDWPPPFTEGDPREWVLTPRGEAGGCPAVWPPLPKALCCWALGATLRAAERRQQLCLVTVLPSRPCLLPCSLELSWEPERKARREAETTGRNEEPRWYWLGAVGGGKGDVVGGGKGDELSLGEEEEKHAAASPSPVESEEKKADC